MKINYSDSKEHDMSKTSHLPGGTLTCLTDKILIFNNNIYHFQDKLEK